MKIRYLKFPIRLRTWLSVGVHDGDEREDEGEEEDDEQVERPDQRVPQHPDHYLQQQRKSPQYIDILCMVYKYF